MRITDKTKEFERPKFCESYYLYKKIFLEEKIVKNNKEILQALYIKDGFYIYCHYMWLDYIHKIRRLIYNSIKRGGWKKNSKTQYILGCDFKFFKDFIEKQFTKGMTWSNYGEWHLDHVYPISKSESFQHCLDLNHYSNFQPLWAIDNIKKGNRINNIK
jgi:hypothetical protein